MLITEFTEAQKAALDIYLDVDAEYKPPSFTLMSQILLTKGHSVSSSTLQRWSKKLDFETHLNRHINALTLASKEDYENLEKEAGAKNLKKTLMTLEENAELLHGSHSVLVLLVQQILDRQKKGFPISKDDAKLMIQLYNITSAREDRLHDRQANLDAVDKITKTELLKQFASTGIDIEALSNENSIEVEIEE